MLHCEEIGSSAALYERQDDLHGEREGTAQRNWHRATLVAHEQAQSPDYPLHNIWNFYYAAANGKSQMTYQYHTSNPYATGVQMSLLDEVLCKTTRSF